MEKELMAEALMLFMDRLESSYLGWMLDNVSKLTKEQMDIAKSFYAYAQKEAEEAIVKPRVGGSYDKCRRLC